MAKKTEIFNPVKEDTSGVQARRAIWSSKSLDMALEGIKQGRKLVANPFYENNTKLLKGDLVFDRTQDEIKEWLKCKNDIIYFVEKYCKLMTPEGIKNVKLREYQRNYLKHLEKHRLSIYLACRQCGKTTTSAVFMLHYILFNVDKNALVLGNKRKTAVEILDKAKKIYLELHKEYNAWDVDMFTFMKDVIKNITINPSENLSTRCPQCGQETVSGVQFPDGIVALFGSNKPRKKFGSR